ncbi:acyl-CoA synthetase (AMP-forming)/AMP-acid ligase II [Kibdelosporangium banguiense]|uniref:Acyl-CoA synthetase (AMP-forming)/AMP-acid ligase II n=1 Tax=Kibdelosporangium banguiense TaxID=1365924 RepID=A0ABS4TWH2_9PSEU|nr:AMP-binding protein [Kibdelosporangium banguiense]MBP2328328.1 acyl-CoA synthetase (AMP-forming)/AMP-acid ligase II [Kibdelosporangium banguiense]
MDVSFGTIWEAVARRLPDAIAISEPGRDYTYADFENRSARLATALDEAGVRAGDKVACYLYNGAAYLETVFAALKIGAVPVNANYRYTREELSTLLTDADATAVVFSGEFAGNVNHAADNVATLRLLVRVGPTPGDQSGPQALGLEEVLSSTPPRPAEHRPGTDQIFMYTGGTTGKPKGVIWRQSDLLHSLAVPIFRPLGVDKLPSTLSEAMDIAVAAHADGRSPAIMPVVPLMHATGLFNSMGALLVGGRVITAQPGGLDPKHVWETVASQRAGTIVVAGNAVCQPLVDELVAAGQAGTPYDLSSVKSVLSSGTALSDRLKRALHEHAKVTIVDAIASSEGGPFAFAITSSVADLPARFFPVPATKVIRSNDQEVLPGTGEQGVLAYGGPMPLGYYKDTAKTATTFRAINGVRYAIPGDLAEVEADGAIRFLGRGSGVINTGGEKVHPQEVEDVLLAHPDITDAVVVGVPDETWGQRVAALVATPNSALAEDQVQDWVRQTLAGYKVPRTVVLLPKLPRTSTGKLEVAWARNTIQTKTRPPIR